MFHCLYFRDRPNAPDRAGKNYSGWHAHLLMAGRGTGGGQATVSWREFFKQSWLSYALRLQPASGRNYLKLVFKHLPNGFYHQGYPACECFHDQTSGLPSLKSGVRSFKAWEVPSLFHTKKNRIGARIGPALKSKPCSDGETINHGACQTFPLSGHILTGRIPKESGRTDG
ncbi:MAG TPA: hypothetical protein VG347_21990 [Verrucomicrobiae bacterium]|nr:hypothetical protein [Verrucomicrobiae bacterium]